MSSICNIYPFSTYAFLKSVANNFGHIACKLICQSRLNPLSIQFLTVWDLFQHTPYLQTVDKQQLNLDNFFHFLTDNFEVDVLQFAL